MSKKILLNIPDEDMSLFEELFSQSDIEIVYNQEQPEIPYRRADYTLLPQQDLKDLRECMNNITAIIGFSVVLQEELDGKLTEYQHEDVETIIENAKEIRNQFVDFFKMTPVRIGWSPFLEPVHINHKLIADILSIFKNHDKNLNITIHIPDELPPASGEEFRIRNNITLVILQLIHEYAQAKSNLNILAQQIEDFILIEFKIDNFTFDINTILTDSNPPQNHSYILTAKLLVEAYGGEFYFEQDVTKDSTIYFSLPIFIE